VAIKWAENMNTGIEKIDSQHKKLVEWINLLDLAIINNFNKDTINMVFMELSNYCNYHFSMEEMLMEKANYPGLEEHKIAHLEFFRVLKENIRVFEKGDDSALAQFMKYLNEWLTNHILVTDKEYIPFVEKNFEE